jgi:hypothetical protein
VRHIPTAPLLVVVAGASAEAGTSQSDHQDVSYCKAFLEGCMHFYTSMSVV